LRLPGGIRLQGLAAADASGGLIEGREVRRLPIRAGEHRRLIPHDPEQADRGARQADHRIDVRDQDNRRNGLSRAWDRQGRRDTHAVNLEHQGTLYAIGGLRVGGCLGQSSRQRQSRGDRGGKNLFGHGHCLHGWAPRREAMEARYNLTLRQVQEGL
jgi:hypothetical protein